MGAIGKEMLNAGLVTKEQLDKAEREAAEKIVNKWREKYGSGHGSMMLFHIIYFQGGLTAIKEMLKK